MLESQYETMKQIAYMSEIGRRREAFCLFMTHRMQTYHREVAEGALDAAHSAGKQITCAKGCSLCCTQFVGVSIQEAEAIVYYLYHNPDVLEFFLSGYDTWRTRSGREEADWAVRISSSPDERQSALNAYNRLNIACPFLRENLCTIYAVRPLTCASLSSVSPAHLCSCSSQTYPVYLIAPVHESDRPPYLWLTEEKQFLCSTMPEMVNVVLSHGYLFLLKWLDSEDLTKEVLSDPFLQGVLSKFQ
jgi:Fe-S-cluster containining protein